MTGAGSHQNSDPHIDDDCADLAPDDTL